MLRTVVTTLALDVALPLLVYLVFTAAGAAPVWALACATGTSIAALAAQWLRTGEFSTLGVLVLVRFALGIAVAAITGDARAALAKDYAITFGVAVFAAMSLTFDRPFIARVRRDLSPDREAFDHQWDSSPAFRTVHRRLTWVWIAGLINEVVIAIGLIYAMPLTTAVILTRVLNPITLIALIATTQFRAHRAARCVGNQHSKRDHA